MNCKIDGCEKEVKARGWCGMHYMRWRRYGSPFANPKSLPPGEAAFRNLLRSYKKWANDKDREWKLTDQEARDYFEDYCYYCGRKPYRVYSHSTYNGDYVHNGIDRVDNEKGYIKENCVSCCAECNFGKGTMTKAEFINMCNLVAQKH